MSSVRKDFSMTDPIVLDTDVIPVPIGNLASYEQLPTDYKAAFFHMSTLLLQAHAYNESGNEDKCTEFVNKAKEFYESVVNKPQYVIK